MQIKFTGEYLSIKSFESGELDNFTVITGKNGSGKSQLLQLISTLANPNNKTISIVPKIQRIQQEGIEGENFTAQNNEIWRKKIASIYQEFKTFEISILELAEKLIVKNNGQYEVVYVDPFMFDAENQLMKNVYLALGKKNKSVATFSDGIAKNIRINNFFNSKKKIFYTAKNIAEYQNKKIKELEEIDFYTTPILEKLINDSKLFGSKIDTIFYTYAKRRDLNHRLYFDKIQHHELNESISDDEFIKENTPPWIIINEILNSHNIPFKFNGIDKFSSEVNVNFKLEKISSSKNILFSNLSSGERTIIGLIIKLFTSEYYSNDLEFPEMLLLDEPDAYLHPEMSKLLIDVLNETFVKKLGIKVIMTTHSPSTVALCPDDNIYQFHNEPDTYLKKIEKSEALKILTGFIPTLSIDYKNHKQVFVESPTDVIYYQTIFNKLNEINSYPFKLYFISNSFGKGNSDQVINIVHSMRSSGNKSSFGIIDWDLKNPKKEFVKVHGHEKRYSVENYIYDPIYIVVLFMNLKAHRIYEELGIDETFNQYNIANESNEFLQKIVDWFFTKFHSIYKTQKEESRVEIEYLNGKKVNVPSWFLNSQGHDYEVKLRKIFDSLEKYSSEGKLQKELCIIIGKCSPLIPKDSEDLIEEIMNS